MRQVLIDRTSRIDAIDLWAISPAPSASRVLASDCSLDSGVVSLVSSSARVVYAALAGDLAVAAAKFAASALSGSTAMLTEAIHPLVDSADQLLLLTGQSRARKPPDRTHPFGYGMETYFWSFVFALLVFFLGGLVAFYQGVRHILMPNLSGPLRSVWECWWYPHCSKVGPSPSASANTNGLSGDEISPCGPSLRRPKIQVFMGHSWRISPRSLGSR